MEVAPPSSCAPPRASSSRSEGLGFRPLRPLGHGPSPVVNSVGSSGAGKGLGEAGAGVDSRNDQGMTMPDYLWACRILVALSVALSRVI
ncbi:hypothetical protein NDU88_003984 [Pleurodeles waltl]|uniref:Uncharacterized protein n=1 Tax=Pleurodeles waltl TaxID=8319 RepID=A0AAV7VHC8_PLEWA|nr:hypothetical protein NDU88_003984 [Pleurodeles waltl]